LAKHVSGRIGADLDVLALKRRYATPYLQNMTRKERHEKLRDVMIIEPAKVPSVTDRHVLLIDDVMTTGATLSACTEVCRTAGAATVSVLTLARVARAE
jgi:predicted amidophosphoribosyltransferase